jgi:hypothetical protein
VTMAGMEGSRRDGPRRDGCLECLSLQITHRSSQGGHHRGMAATIRTAPHLVTCTRSCVAPLGGERLAHTIEDLGQHTGIVVGEPPKGAAESVFLSRREIHRSEATGDGDQQTSRDLVSWRTLLIQTQKVAEQCGECQVWVRRCISGRPGEADVPSTGQLDVSRVWQWAIALTSPMAVPFTAYGERQGRRFAWGEQMALRNDVAECELHRELTSENCSSPLGRAIRLSRRFSAWSAGV